MISRANSAMSAGSSGSKAEYQSPLAATWRITSRAASIRSSMAPRLARGPEALRADRARIHAELERQLDLADVERRRGDRVRALRAVAVRRREPDVVVLARQVLHPHRHLEPERLHARRLHLHVGDGRDLPLAGRPDLDRRQSFQ